ncbi:MAG: patatin-like phospholipase family protein, partial [Alphaproteobacteria bacterium]
LRTFWERIARTARLSAPGAASGQFMAQMGLFLSPYQTNPLNLDPLRTILIDTVDFERLRAESPVRLIVAATNLRTEEARLFTNREITADVLLASACLPMMHHAVRLEGDAYWDGGFTANPPILPIVERARAHETLLVRLMEVGSAAPPSSAPEITAHMHRLAFNRPLADELAQLKLLHRLAAELSTTPHRLLRNAGRHRLHEIDGPQWLDARLRAQWASPGPGVIEAMHGHGRRAADHWLRRKTEPEPQTSPQ